MLKISYADCPSLFPAILAQFTSTICVAAQDRKKLLKLLFWGSKVIQGHQCWHP